MKLFERTSSSGWCNRLNLIDGNNVFVGYDYSQDCCENFGYYFQEADGTKLDQDPNLNNAFFTLNHKDVSPLDDDDWNEWFGIAFEIKLQTGEMIWFTIYNDHNGCATHGFDFGKNVGADTKPEYYETGSL